MGNYCDEHAKAKQKLYGETAITGEVKHPVGAQGAGVTELLCSMGCGKVATKQVMGTPQAEAPAPAEKPKAPAKKGV